MKKITMMLIALVFCMSIPVVGMAAPMLDGGVPMTIADSAASPRAAGGTSKISKVSATSVRISGSTISTADSKVSVQLQVLKGGSWKNYGSAVSSSGRGTVTASKVVTVDSGYQYRAKSIHNGSATSYSGVLSM